MTSDCIFCKIIAGEIPTEKVYEDDLVVGFMDHQPVSRGHVLVMAKKTLSGFLNNRRGNTKGFDHES